MDIDERKTVLEQETEIISKLNDLSHIRARVIRDKVKNNAEIEEYEEIQIEGAQWLK